MNQIMVVAGPTASGKTDFAIRLAKHFGGEVISADSIQIYQELDIASAKPSKAEMQGIPHHLLNIISPFERFSVAEYVKRANGCIQDILSRGALPIVAGGTGLYISSLVDNISFAEEQQDTSVRNRLWEEANENGGELLYERLKNLDPEGAEGIHPNNVKRVIRALEIYETTGLTLSQQNAISKRNPSPYEPYMVALCPPREILYERIEKRVDSMVQQGLFEESRRLRDMGLTKEIQSMQGIGYKEVFAYLEGTITREMCIEEIKKATRHYAKRQLTWFRRDARYRWINPLEENAIDVVLEEFTWKKP
ncbi:MAG: tRNA (adenosine(37)-N6)-dimethylallyltransferase MiaA [Ruminococcaceae bacterium]|nr:tRNA (adenosine(37)-N6)-dimethylallyltransferase MiaA [Oscillospiraceae bacterium]